MDLREMPVHAFARHPWEIVRADFFLGLLRERLVGSGLRALDIGAGDGYLASRLLAEQAAVAQATCFDTGYDGTWIGRQGGDGRRPDFTAERPSGTFDLVLLLDVLEHADDDRRLLAEAVASAAEPGGWVVLSVPAHPGLFSRHDERLGHRRRYSPARLRALAAGAGLDIVATGQLFTSLLVPRALAKLGEAALGGRTGATPGPGRIETALGTWHHGPMVTRAVKTLLAADAAGSRLAARWRLPIPGLSTWVLGRRR
jgi:SAM-dependent methyltransferase